MPKVNYKFNKRQKEIAKKKKRDEKVRRKQENKSDQATEIPAEAPTEDMPVGKTDTEDTSAEKPQETPET